MGKTEHGGVGVLYVVAYVGLAALLTSALLALDGDDELAETSFPLWGAVVLGLLGSGLILGSVERLWRRFKSGGD